VKVVEEHPHFTAQRCGKSKKEMCVNYFVSFLVILDPKAVHNYF
jgi:hypothetical protein